MNITLIYRERRSTRMFVAVPRVGDIVENDGSLHSKDDRFGYQDFTVEEVYWSARGEPTLILSSRC